MNHSGKLCTELLCEYSDFSPYKKGKSFVGYKLAEKKGGPNYYSIVSGMFRYKSRNVDNNSYSELYRREKMHYNKKLDDKLAIFVEKEDAIDALVHYKEISGYRCELVLIEITISKDLEKAKYSNKYISDVEVVIGGSIDKVKEIKQIVPK